MTPYFADTWFFLALLNPGDVAHQRVVEFAGEVDRGVVTSDWILVEVADALCSPSHRHLYRILDSTLHCEERWTVVGASRSHLKAGQAMYFDRPDKSWSLTDCISFSIMRRRKLTEALTADRHFEQAGFRAMFLR
ncbi:MAG: type II toxin-antitoxin system VapC family toxin [Planctomycetes bacterium]|nr:type II toxin-antitoxin system VapC family toxin [Planctomycetota bacterium]